MINKLLGLKKETLIIILLAVFISFGLIISAYRGPKSDGTYYFSETILITELLKRGMWFGDYGVGLHGFIFKLPVALIYLITGPSVFVATFFNFILGAATIYLFYKILDKYFNFGYWSVAGAYLLATNSIFISMNSRYLREVPSIFSLLLFIYLILYKKSKWLIGIALLLVFDARETTLYAVFPSVIVWILYESIVENRDILIKRIIKGFRNLLILSLPSVTYLILSFYTSIIPINMVNASLFGLTTKGLEYQFRHFKPTIATSTAIKEYTDSPTLAVQMKKQEKTNDNTKISLYLLIIKNYALKMMTPLVFSLLTISKTIIAVTAFSAALFLIQVVKNKNTNLVIMPLIYLTFLGVVIIRASIGRYFFPVTFLSIFFFILFLKDQIRRKYFSAYAIIFSIIFTTLGWQYENKSLFTKMLLETFILLSLILYWYSKNNIIKKSRIFPVVLISSIGVISFGTILMSMLFFEEGQLNWALKWGPNMECKKIVSLFKDDEKIWISNPGWDDLPKLYRKNTYVKPEWNWALSSKVHKKQRLKTLGEETIYNFSLKNMYDFEYNIKEFNIKKLYLVVSDLEEHPLPEQNKLETLLKDDWVSLSETHVFKNKKVYVFDVIY